MAVVPYVNDVVRDAALDLIANNADLFHVCSDTGASVDYSSINTATLGSVACTSGDFAKADDTSGRKLTFTPPSAVTISTGGTAAQVTLTDGTSVVYSNAALSSTVAVSISDSIDVSAYICASIADV